MKILEFFAGYYNCTAANHKIRVVNFMIRRGIPYSEVRECDGAITFKVLKKDVKRNPEILEMCEDATEKGLHPAVKKSLSRPGLLIGIVIFAAALIISGMFVWDVSLATGGDENAERIIRVLEENGLKRGTLKKNIDKRKLENIVMLTCPDVAFVAVNMTGNGVTVVTDERVLKETEKINAPCDLVAAEDGYVIRYETYKGQPVCEAKTAVKRGDVLISGALETKHHGIEFVHSEGRVFALVKRSYLVQTTAGYTEKYYTGNEYKTVNVKLFSFELNVRNETLRENCEVFETEKQLSVLGIINLPVFIKTTVYREYAFASMKRSEEQVREELKRLSAEQFALLTENCDVVSSADTVYEKNGVWYLYSDVWCISDIAVKAPLHKVTEENGK